jgi:UPF0176 protein
MAQLHNRVNKDILRKQLKEETFKRITLSFYRYVIYNDPAAERDLLYKKFKEWNVFGRIYIAHEGINAQISIPDFNFDAFKVWVNNDVHLKNIPFKIAVEDDGKSFYKLIIKVRQKIVADGLDDDSFDVTNVGRHLNAEEFNAAIDLPDTIVVDMRNHYESEVGRFEKAICPEADTFKEELPMVVDLLKGKEDKKIIMYCTGGVRCEKASAYLKHSGFKDVNQLYGGIIEYAKEIKLKGLPSKFHGKNFVFDERLGERITDEIISVCHQCGVPCDDHTNCANNECHLLFIQCAACADKMKGCCTPRCKTIIELPIEEQRKIRKGKLKQGKDAHAVYKSRLRPNLMDAIKNNPEIFKPDL